VSYAPTLENPMLRREWDVFAALEKPVKYQALITRYMDGTH
jgi:hypothetical protein